MSVSQGLFQGVHFIEGYYLAPILLLSFDLAYYLFHRFGHQYSFLWRWHKFHHTAEVLTPLTVLRLHPIELILRSLFIVGFTAMITGLITPLADQSNYQSLFYSLALSIFYFAGYHLRHSHVCLSFSYLEYLFISPRMHQYHHLILHKEQVKNYGLIFSFWDLLGKSFYRPLTTWSLPIPIYQANKANKANKANTDAQEFNVKKIGKP